MTVQEFKEKFPHLAHLEGDALWDAMAMAVWKEQPQRESLPDDDEIAYTATIGDGYTLEVTKGAQRTWEEFIGKPEPLKFGRMMIMMPRANGGWDEYDENGIVKQ